MQIRLMLLSCIFVIYSSIVCNSQENPCGTSHSDQRKMLELQAKLPELNHYQEGGLIQVPIQVHMLLTDEGNGIYNLLHLDEALCTLNKDFEQTGFQFYMEQNINYIRSSKWNDHENFRDGIEMMKVNNFPDVVNCYIVSNPAGNCGYFAWDGDAVALSKSCLGGGSHTWAHELGHYFSLPHTFYGWEGISYSGKTPTSEYQSRVWTQIENVNRVNCKDQADGYCDTPPDYISSRWSCDENKQSSYFLKDIDSVSFQVDGSLFMSYSNDRCMNRFTADQSEAMQKFLNFNRSRLLRTNIFPMYMESLDKTVMTPLDSSVVADQNVTFSWPKIEGAEGYIFQLARNSAFTITVKFISLNTNQITIDNLVSGRNYYWRVKPFNKYDFCYKVSDTRFFQYSTISSVSINQNANSNITIYPNPAFNSNEVLIQSELDEITKVILINQLGQKIRTISEKVHENLILLKTQDLQKGIYFVTIETNHKIFTKKLLIK